MAYNSNEIGLRIGAAANQAAQVLPYLGSLDSVEQAVKLHKELAEGFLANMEAIQADQGGTVKTAPSGEQALRDEFGATDTGTASGFQVKVLGKQHGPIPAWLNEAAQAAGVPAVFDNRVDRDGNDITGTKKPWFRSPRDPREGPADKPFWPPRR